MLAVTALTAVSVLVLQGSRGDISVSAGRFAVPQVALAALPVGYAEKPENLALLPTPDALELANADPLGDPGTGGDPQPSDPFVSNPADGDPEATATPGPNVSPTATPLAEQTQRPRKTRTPKPARDPNAIAYAYTVQPGDTLSGIATEHSVSVDSILWNNIHVTDANELYVGQQLQVPAVDGVIYSVSLGDTLSGIASEYGSDLDKIITFKANGIANADSVPLNTQILIPGGKPPAPEAIPDPTAAPDPSETPPATDPTAEPPPTVVPPGSAIPPGPAHTTDNLRLRAGSSADRNVITTMPLNSTVEILDAPKNGWYPVRYAGLTGWASGDYLAAGAPDPSAVPTPGPPGPSGWQWPLIGPINSYFSPGHPLGIDIGTNRVTGLPIVAAKAGTVIFAGGNACCSYGYYIIIDHGGGFTSRYGHLSSIGVSLGQQVGTGQQIGLSGNTGYSTGPHLHFEIRINGTPVNPLSYLP